MCVVSHLKSNRCGEGYFYKIFFDDGKVFLIGFLDSRIPKTSGLTLKYCCQIILDILVVYFVIHRG